MPPSSSSSIQHCCTIHHHSNDTHHRLRHQNCKRSIHSFHFITFACALAVLIGVFVKPSCHHVEAFVVQQPSLQLSSSLTVLSQIQHYQAPLNHFDADLPDKSFSTRIIKYSHDRRRTRKSSSVVLKMMKASDNNQIMEGTNLKKNDVISYLPNQRNQKLEEEEKDGGGNEINVSKNRRSLLFLSSLLVSSTTQLPLPSFSNANAALPFLPSSEPRRQLELCLVTILRVQYWAESISTDITDRLLSRSPSDTMTDFQKQPFLEARLGAKALLTGRIGGGATSKVYTLASLQLKGCIKDAQSHHAELYKSSSSGNYKLQKFTLENAATQIIESLGSVVEFDGLETTTDPSPRSSLMLSMYNVDKARFVQRMLREQTVPSCEAFIKCFDGGIRKRCEDYVFENYRAEMSVKRRKELELREFAAIGTAAAE